MNVITDKRIQWIATEIDDLSLLLRVQGLDRVANMLDEAIVALQPAHSDASLPSGEGCRLAASVGGLFHSTTPASPESRVLIPCSSKIL